MPIITKHGSIFDSTADVWPLYQKHLSDLPATVEVWIHD